MEVLPDGLDHTGSLAWIEYHHSLRLGTFISILRAVAGHKGVPREAIIEDL
jgi:hypothetical protein